MNIFRTAVFVTALAALSTPAFAHAHLVDSTPAAKSTDAAPSMLVLHFSEGLEGKFSKFSVVSGGKPVAVSVALDPKDDKTLIGTPAAPLAPGLYTVNWTSVAKDAHKLTGSYDFTVK
jgi:hypothetical protein